MALHLVPTLHFTRLCLFMFFSTYDGTLLFRTLLKIKMSQTKIRSFVTETNAIFCVSVSWDPFLSVTKMTKIT
jgi:hypothetical protein